MTAEPTTDAETLAQPLSQPVPNRIWLLDLGSGDIVWSADPDPDGVGEEGVEYVRTALANQPPSSEGERYRHKARGTEYSLLGHAELQDATGEGVEEGALLCIYRGDDGKLWARRSSEFGDGRFERLALSDHPASNSKGADHAD